jgi:hypothetical protein
VNSGWEYLKAIDRAEDREKFRLWMIEMGIPGTKRILPIHFREGKEFAQILDIHWCFAVIYSGSDETCSKIR